MRGNILGQGAASKARRGGRKEGEEKREEGGGGGDGTAGIVFNYQARQYMDTDRALWSSVTCNKYLRLE